MPSSSDTSGPSFRQPPWRRCACAAALLATATVLTAPAGAADHAEEQRCGTVSQEAARRVFEALQAIPAAPCKFEGLSTQRSRLVATWSLPEGSRADLQLLPSRCAPAQAVQAGALSFVSAPALAAACGGVVAALLPALGGAARRGELAAPAERAGSPGAVFPVFVVASLCFAAAAVLLLASALARRRRRRSSAPSQPGEAAPPVAATAPAWVLLAAFAVALVARLLVEAAPSNWYAEVLPPEGLPENMRFGPGTYVVQTVLRALLPWTDTTLQLFHILLGALAVPLFLGALRVRALDLGTALALGALLALAPLHVRASASPNEHVLASTLALAALWAFVVSQQRRDPWLGLASMALAACAVCTRADAWPALGAIPLWSLWRDREAPQQVDEGLLAAARSRRLGTWAWSAAFWAVWAGVGTLAYFYIVVPSNHPAPTVDDVLLALRDLFPQYPWLAFRWPHWFAPIAVMLAVPGLVGLLLRRPRLLACVVVTLVFTFVPLGRTLGRDELLGARYFLASLPVVLLLAAYGSTVVLELVWSGCRRLWRSRALPLTVPRWAVLAWSVALAGGLTASGWPAFQVTYTFQDEYRFLRKALAALPAGCQVLELPLRDAQAFDRDLDCCLDLARSPLRIAFPKLVFATLDPVTGPPPIEGSAACRSYYEGPACSMRRAPDLALTRGRAHDAFTRRCADARRLGVLELLAQDTMSGRSTNDLFEGHRVPARLWRVSPARPVPGPSPGPSP